MTEIKHRVDSDGTETWTHNGMLHREDGPAAIRPDGTEEWWQYGRLHRKDGPAMILPDGTQLWWQHGYRHREDGPAIVCADGAHLWSLRNQQLTFQEWLDQVCLSDKEKTLMILRWSHS